MDENPKPEVTEKKKPEPLPVEPDGEVLDWDAYSPPPPPKNPRKIRVRFLHKRQTEPMPYPGPEIEMSDKDALEQSERPETIQPTPVCEEDVEKDDVTIVTPKPRRSGTILVHLKYGGRRKPIPVEFPHEDGDDAVAG